MAEAAVRWRRWPPTTKSTLDHASVVRPAKHSLRVAVRCLAAAYILFGPVRLSEFQHQNFRALVPLPPQLSSEPSMWQSGGNGKRDPETRNIIRTYHHVKLNEKRIGIERVCL